MSKTKYRDVDMCLNSEKNSLSPKVYVTHELLVNIIYHLPHPEASISILSVTEFKGFVSSRGAAAGNVSLPKNVIVYPDVYL